MKRIFLAASMLLLCAAIHSQDYSNICSKGITLYKDTAGFLQGYRYDSLEVTGDQDSIFTSFPAIIYDSMTGFYDSAGGGILGRKIIKTNSGYFIFLAGQENSFLIKPNAGLNES
jgi:hypothetical protein